MADMSLWVDSARGNIVYFVPATRPLRDDVPEFDPTNETHLRAWEAIFDLSQVDLYSRNSRRDLELQIEGQIALLDAIDGDPDIEPREEDCCSAHDDDPRPHVAGGAWFGEAGDPEDAEVDEDLEPDDHHLPVPIYGAKQGTYGAACELRAADQLECGSV